MSLNRQASTDTLSSLPLIACCIVSVMVLASVMSSMGSRASERQEMDDLRDFGNKLLGSAMEVLSSEGEDHIRYLFGDWRSKSSQMLSLMESEGDFNSTVAVRVRSLGECVMAESGDIGHCLMVVSMSSPVLLCSEGATLVGEIAVTVGK